MVRVPWTGGGEFSPHLQQASQKCRPLSNWLGTEGGWNVGHIGDYAVGPLTHRNVLNSSAYMLQGKLPTLE